MYHVITLSDMGEADIPPGGSSCMRCDMSVRRQTWKESIRAYLEVAHQAATSGGGHDDIKKMRSQEGWRGLLSGKKSRLRGALGLWRWKDEGLEVGGFERLRLVFGGCGDRVWCWMCGWWFGIGSLEMRWIASA